jgi:hypothetical protein
VNQPGPAVAVDRGLERLGALFAVGLGLLGGLELAGEVGVRGLKLTHLLLQLGHLGPQVRFGDLVAGRGRQGPFDREEQNRGRAE